MADRDTYGPTVPLLLILSAMTGLIDAVSVLALGKVFTANMTGNIVFLGFALAGTPGFHWPLFVTALLAFAVGAALSGRLYAAWGERGRRRWLMTAAASEAALLFAAAAIAALFELRPDSWPIIGMIALTAVAMGNRNATVRALKVPDLSTTVLTLTITGLAADSTLAGGSNPNVGRRLAAIGAILAGSAAGAALVLSIGPALPLVCAATVTLVATMLLAHDLPVREA